MRTFVVLLLLFASSAAYADETALKKYIVVLEAQRNEASNRHADAEARAMLLQDKLTDMAVKLKELEAKLPKEDKPKEE